MSQITNTVCDGCGRVKGETNHWFRVAEMSHSFTTRMDINPYDKRKHNDYCSQGCVTKAFQEWLNAQQEAHEATIQNSVDCNNGYEKPADEVELEAPTKECSEIIKDKALDSIEAWEAADDEDFPF